MSKTKTAYVLKSFNNGDDITAPTVRRGEKITVDELRYKDLKASGLISDSPPPRRPGPREGRTPTRRTQERQGRRTQERPEPDEAGVTDDELEYALDVFKRAGLAPPDATVEQLRAGLDYIEHASREPEAGEETTAGADDPPPPGPAPGDDAAAGDDAEEKPPAADADASTADDNPPAAAVRPKRGNRAAS